MSTTDIQGRVVRIPRPAEFLYAVFTDLNNFTKNLPGDMIDKSQVTSTEDTLVAKVQGFELGLQIGDRTPFSRIKYRQYGNSPFPFEFTVNLTAIDPGHTDFQLGLSTELPAMFKMMLGSKLQEVIDKVTDQIESAFNF